MKKNCGSSLLFTKMGFLDTNGSTVLRKLNISLSTSCRHKRKVKLQFCYFLTSVLFGVEGSTSKLDRFVRKKRKLLPIEWETGWARGRSARFGYDKNLLHAVNLTPNRPNCTVFAILTTSPGSRKVLNLNVDKCPKRCNYTQFILSVNCSIYFDWFFHPSSEAQIFVCTASGTGQLLLLRVGIVEELRQRISLNSVSDRQQQHLTSSRCCRYSYLCS